MLKQQRVEHMSSLSFKEQDQVNSSITTNNDPSDIIEACESLAWAQDPTGKHVQELMKQYQAILIG